MPRLSPHGGSDLPWSVAKYVLLHIISRLLAATRSKGGHKASNSLTCIVMFCFVSMLANAALVGTKTVMPAGCPSAMLPESPAQYSEVRKALRL